MIEIDRHRSQDEMFLPVICRVDLLISCSTLVNLRKVIFMQRRAQCLRPLYSIHDHQSKLRPLLGLINQFSVGGEEYAIFSLPSHWSGGTLLRNWSFTPHQILFSFPSKAPYFYLDARRLRYTCVFLAATPGAPDQYRQGAPVTWWSSSWDHVTGLLTKQQISVAAENRLLVFSWRSIGETSFSNSLPKAAVIVESFRSLESINYIRELN